MTVAARELKIALFLKRKVIVREMQEWKRLRKQDKESHTYKKSDDVKFGERERFRAIVQEELWTQCSFTA